MGPPSDNDNGNEPSGGLATPFKVLVFSKTVGYRHASIPAGISALERLAAASTSASVSPAPFAMDASEDAAVFAPSNLAQYRVIVFLQVSGDFLDGAQLDALKGFVRSGGGVVGVHGASTGMPSRKADFDGWYGRLIGAVFDEHPKPQPGVVRLVDGEHAILARGLASKAVEAAADGSARTWKWFDEWYNFRADPRENGVHVLLEVDEGSYIGGKMGPNHAIAWCNEFEGGRSFYTALGHFDEAYQDDTFMGQLLNAILWTAGVIS